MISKRGSNIMSALRSLRPLRLCDASILRYLAAKKAEPVKNLRRFLKEKPAPSPQAIYERSVSLHQSSLSKSGKCLEDAFSRVLDSHGIEYMTQACVDGNGEIIPKRSGHRIHDFVINGALGKNIEDLTIISCKMSLRERFLQDSNIPCRRLFLVTLDKTALKKEALLLKNHNIHLVLVAGPKGSNISTLMSMLRQSM